MDNPQFYEQFDWSGLESKTLKPKIEKIFEIMPEDVKNIIDIGCGNGMITNALNQKFDITGVDRSAHALKNVETKKIEASAESIPVKDQSFDMVFSSELLEHLPDEVFQKAITEFKRISKKYLLISVPNRENLNKNLIQCPECNYIYNRSYHLKSFKPSDWEDYFPEYQLIGTYILGAKIRHYNPVLSKIKRRISPPISWIPYYIMPREKRKTMCPKCEYSFEYRFKFNMLSFSCDMLNILISPKRPYWQMVLLKK